MARHDRYNDRNRFRQQDNRDEGFFDRVRDWFSDSDDEREEERDWEYRQRYNRGYNRGEQVGLHHPDYSFGQQGWTTSTYDRDYGRGYGQESDRDYDRDYGQEVGRDYDRDRDQGWDRDADWERTRQWRRNAGRDAGQDTGRTTFGNRYGKNYSQAGWNSGDYRGEDYREGSGRSYNRGRFDRDQDEQTRGQRYNRDWEYRQDTRDEIDRRQFYGYGQEYDPESARYNYYNRDRPQARQQRYGNMRRQPYETAGMRSDFEGRARQYPSAGMRSDYGSESEYDNRQTYDEARSYGQDYIGYEREGAFYQDLDEPVNYEYWEVWEIPGEYTGMGPHNYRRSDESITDDVCQRLTSHGRVDASQIEIEVEDGEVVLKGTVPNREMKRMAEDTAESVRGVQDVRNEIKVQRQEGRSNWSGWDYDQNQDQSRAHQPDQQQTQPQKQQRTRKESQIPSTGMAGQTTAGAGLTSGGATSMGAMEAASGVETKRSQLREGMEVIGKNGKVVGRVKEIRQGDFLVDRDMARDLYIPYDAVSTVGAQAMLNIEADKVDDQDWEKPDLIG